MAKIHHLNCISTCPLGGLLMDARTPSLVRRGHLTCHCLLVETNEGLVLLDTGFGLRDVHAPRTRLSWFFLALVDPDFREDLTAIRQIARLGFNPRDVRHIVMTHLDFDHAGGLDDFPNATVHMLVNERDYALQQRTWLDRQRFRPQQWSTAANWKTYDAGGDTWFGFEKVRELNGVSSEIALIPLAGHTFGHAGIGVQRNDGGWLLLAGDAYFFRREMDVQHPVCTPGLAFYQVMLEKDRRSRLANQQRLRDLKRDHGGEVEIFCSHDLIEFERLSGRSAELPERATAERVAPAPAL
ncbi:MAG TPA: MBL fold metallo-hydrolase [Thermoanaerobaculia bacterium]|jgi:glyoxylase-like metal-dependent hydrolase (beta-lactamase superfamily II)|nr:MBL fold metallo-hydrolase [Thermoanaerobaculia bacterium]